VIYPGIVLGLMVGLTRRSVISAALGALVGLVESIAGYFPYVGIGSATASSRSSF